MFKETKEGQTHSYNDGCGEPAHNHTAEVGEWREEFDKEFFYRGDGLWGHWIDGYDEDDKYVGKSRAYLVPEALIAFISRHITAAYEKGVQDTVATEEHWKELIAKHVAHEEEIGEMKADAARAETLAAVRTAMPEEKPGIELAPGVTATYGDDVGWNDYRTALLAALDKLKP